MTETVEIISGGEGESALLRAVATLEEDGWACFGLCLRGTAVVLARKDSFRLYAGRAEAEEILSGVKNAPDLDAETAAWHVGCAIAATLLLLKDGDFS